MLASNAVAVCKGAVAIHVGCYQFMLGSLGHSEARGSAVVQSLRCKPEGRGFDLVSMEFFTQTILLAALWPRG
jgi:hypothetical protein